MRVRRSLVALLPVRVGIAEHAEEVVEQLEGDPQQPADLSEAVTVGVVGAGEHGSGLEGKREGVGARLLLLHRQALGQ